MMKQLQTTKRLLALLIALTIVMGTTRAANFDFSAVTPEGQTLYYKITDATNHYVQVIAPYTDWAGYTRPTGDLYIPETVTSSGVTFYVKSIGASAFYNCVGLTSVDTGDGVTSISNGAFTYCSGLTRVTIGRAVTTLYRNAFSGSGQSHITEIEFLAENLTEIAGSGYSSPFYTSRNGITSVIIGNSVTCIPPYLCASFGNLTSVNIPNSVTTIGTDAFSECTGLTSVVIPNSVVTSGGFYGCTGLTSVTIGNSVTNITVGAFQGCTGITSIVIPNSVESIGEKAFYNTSNLTSVTIGNSVTSIGSAAFSGSMPSRNVYFSGSIEQWCGISFVSEASNPLYSSVNFYVNSNELVTDLVIPNSVTSIGNNQFIGAQSLTSVIIPSSVTSIGQRAFQSCSNLSSITIGSSASSIGYLGFGYCTGLTSITVLRQAPPTISSYDDVFKNVPKFIPVYVLCGAVNSYSTATGWSSFTNYQEIQFDIMTSATPTAGGSVSGAGTYCYNASCTLIATPSEGYTFTNWKKGNTVVSTSATYTFNVTEAASYTATFTLNSYAITATANPTAGGSVTGAGTYSHGASCTLTATPATGYNFTKWTKNGTQVSTSASYTFTVSAACTYVAQFTKKTYSITASADPAAGGTVTGAGTYEHGANVTLTATAETGYTFVNWTRNGSQVSTNPNYSFTATVAGAYVAHFTLNSYAIAASANPTAGGTVSGAGTYNHGASCTLTATPATGYTFTNWKKGNAVVSTSANYTFTVTEAASYTATFTLNSYTITATANPTVGGTVSGAGTYNHGASCTLTATPATGYTFTNWKKGNTVVSTSTNYTFTVTEAASYTATFTLNSYAITATANPTSGGTVSGAGTYNHGDQVTLTATANEGYTFVDWTENGVAVTTDASYSFMAIGDRDLVANFSEMTFTNHWTTITGTQFNMTMSGLIYIDGAVQASTALEIGAFCGDECRGSARAQFFPPTGEYVVSLTVVSNLQSGENITFRLYDHVTQQEFPTECVNSITFVANSSHGEMGNWYPYAFNNAVAITAVVTPEGAGVVEGFGDYLPGTSCTLTATANTGYAFRSWSVAGEVVSTDNPYTFTVSGGVEVTANFDSQETTALTEGWTWWSTSIELSGIDGLTMLEESLGHNGLVIKAANKFVQNYYPSLGYDYWFGQLGSDDFTNASSYMIQTTADCEVTMTGTYADPSDHPIQLYPNWTWIGYPCGVQQSATSAFTGFIPTANDKVKGQYAFSTYYDNYGWFPEFTMTPGQGYMYQSNASDTRTLTFANGSKADPMPANQENLYWRSNVHAYADNMNVIAVVTIEGEEQGGEGLELGAFVNGECRGSVFLKHFPPTDRWYAMLTVTGMDGDKVEFGIMDRGRGMASMTSDKSLFFQSNAVIGELDEPCTINFSTMGCAENNLESPMHIYPNPIRRNETFRILVPLGEKVAEMTIVNTLGAVICHKVGAIDSLEMEGLPVAGVYMVRVVSDSGNVYYGKLIVR